MKIVVIGGTGLIGSKIVEQLKQKGHEAIEAAPSTGVNTVTGEGLAQALAGAEVVIDVANSPSFEDRAAMDFFQAAGKNITAAEVADGVKHHVALSVVGTDRLQDSGYFRAKQAQENIIKSSPIPYTIIHATQFFEFVRAIAEFSMVGDTVRLPPVRFQPMAAVDVSTAIAEAALAQPVNGTLEIAGPDTFTLDQPVRMALEYDNDARKVIADPAAPYYGVKVSEKTLVPGAGARLGPTKFDWWLTHVPPPQKPQR
ncbi:MAG: SDR family oxidoreductase [Xanthobacteraceae bacterium]